LSGVIGHLLINGSSRSPHFEKMAAVKMHPPGSRRLGVHYAASILQSVADCLNNQIGNCERSLAVAPRSYPDDLRATVERNRSRLSDRAGARGTHIKGETRYGGELHAAQGCVRYRPIA